MASRRAGSPSVASPQLGLPHVTDHAALPGRHRAARSRPRPSTTMRAAPFARPGSISPAWRTHGRCTAPTCCARRPGGGWAGAGDILATTERRVPLAIFTADCLAITLWDLDRSRARAVAHVGWRGTARGAARRRRARGGRGGRARRPAARGHRAVDRAVLLRGRRAGDAGVRARRSRGAGSAGSSRCARGTPCSICGRPTRRSLADAGVDPAQIENPRVCTACHLDLLYSYRKGNRGRLVTVAALP